MRQLAWCVCVVKTDNCGEKPLQFLVSVKLIARLDVRNLVTVVLGVSCLGSLQVICRDWLLDFGFVTLHKDMPDRPG